MMSPSLEKQYVGCVPPDIRETYFAATGTYGSDSEILVWWNRASGAEPVSTGGPTDFYDIGNCKDVDDLVEHWDLGFDGGNCLKALVGIAKGSRHSGTSPMRDANKLLHYAKRIAARLEKDNS